MGTDKARLRVGRRTLLGIIRGEAGKLGVKVRVIRRDLVERCGPLGGIFTGLKTTRCNAVLFLACDMPLISVDLLLKVLSQLSPGTGAVFVQSKSAGFPFVLRKELLAVVEEQIAAKAFSIHQLCRALQAKTYQPDESEMAQLSNINTPQEWGGLRKKLSTGPAKP